MAGMVEGVVEGEVEREGREEERGMSVGAKVGGVEVEVEWCAAAARVLWWRAARSLPR